MKKIRAVVEISVPDKVNLTEMQFAKLLRRNMPTGLHLKPVEMATRPLQFKEFGRVVQYGPDGARIVATKAPSPFESLVLFALWAILHSVIGPRQLSKSTRLRAWFRDVRATLDAAETEDEEPWEHPDRKAAREEQLQLHSETVATARKEGRLS